ESLPHDVAHRDAAAVVAAELESRPAPLRLLQRGDALRVPQLVLRDRALPAGDADGLGHARDQPLGREIPRGDRDELVVRERGSSGIARAAEEHREERPTGRRAVWKQARAPDGAEDAAVRARRDEVPEAGERTPERAVLPREVQNHQPPPRPPPRGAPGPPRGGPP